MLVSSPSILILCDTITIVCPCTYTLLPFWFSLFALDGSLPWEPSRAWTISLSLQDFKRKTLIPFPSLPLWFPLPWPSPPLHTSPSLPLPLPSPFPPLPLPLPSLPFPPLYTYTPSLLYHYYYSPLPFCGVLPVRCHHHHLPGSPRFFCVPSATACAPLRRAFFGAPLWQRAVRTPLSFLQALPAFALLRLPRTAAFPFCSPPRSLTHYRRVSGARYGSTYYYALRARATPPFSTTISVHLRALLHTLPPLVWFVLRAAYAFAALRWLRSRALRMRHCGLRACHCWFRRSIFLRVCVALRAHAVYVPPLLLCRFAFVWFFALRVRTPFIACGSALYAPYCVLLHAFFARLCVPRFAPFTRARDAVVFLYGVARLHAVWRIFHRAVLTFLLFTFAHCLACYARSAFTATTPTPAGTFGYCLTAPLTLRRLPPPAACAACCARVLYRRRSHSSAFAVLPVFCMRWFYHRFATAFSCFAHFTHYDTTRSTYYVTCPPARYHLPLPPFCCAPAVPYILRSLLHLPHSFFVRTIIYVATVPAFTAYTIAVNAYLSVLFVLCGSTFFLLVLLHTRTPPQRCTDPLASAATWFIHRL